jgi:hypothetical protein
MDLQPATKHLRQLQEDWRVAQNQFPLSSYTQKGLKMLIPQLYGKHNNKVAAKIFQNQVSGAMRKKPTSSKFMQE